jgi:mannose-6-phosphate isomerase-like protein (cupin superfamily)
VSAAAKYNLNSAYLRLRPDSSIEPLPTGDDFWPRLMAGALGDFHHEYLVTTFTYDRDWSSWERHPKGDEIVCLLSGVATLVLDESGGPTRIELREPGDYVRVPRGTWHTAKTTTPTTMLFITAGEGTENRPLE